VRLAAERTLLAWVRTGLAMMGFGFVVARFGFFLEELEASRGVPRPAATGISLWIGLALVGLGVLVNMLASLENYRFARRLERGEPYQPARWSLGIVVSVMLAAMGTGMMAYLLFVRY
jgi:putative membrane protein